MPILPRLTHSLRRREISRRAHFQRTAALAGAVVAVWLIALLALGGELWAGSAVAGSSIVFWMLMPLLALIAFDRLQTTLDRSGGGEH